MNRDHHRSWPDLVVLLPLGAWFAAQWWGGAPPPPPEVGRDLLLACLIGLGAILLIEAPGGPGRDWRTPWLRCLAATPLVTLAWLLGSGQPGRVVLALAAFGATGLALAGLLKALARLPGGFGDWLGLWVRLALLGLLWHTRSAWLAWVAP